MNTELVQTEAYIRDKIAQLEAALFSMAADGVPTVDMPLKHTFADGVYIREIFIPADTIVVGKIHKHDHFNFMTFGRVTCLTKDGLQEFVAPCTMVSTAGTKRALYTHTDTVWTTVHANPENETSLEKLEAVIIAPDYTCLPSEQLKIEEQ